MTNWNAKDTIYQCNNNKTYLVNLMMIVHVMIMYGNKLRLWKLDSIFHKIDNKVLDYNLSPRSRQDKFINKQIRHSK